MKKTKKISIKSNSKIQSKLKCLSKVYFIVLYVEDSAPKLKPFISLKSAKQFAAKIEKKSSDDGYWVDLIIEGKLIQADPYYLSMFST